MHARTDDSTRRRRLRAVERTAIVRGAKQSHLAEIRNHTGAVRHRHLNRREGRVAIRQAGAIQRRRNRVRHGHGLAARGDVHATVLGRPRPRDHLRARAVGDRGDADDGDAVAGGARLWTTIIRRSGLIKRPRRAALDGLIRCADQRERAVVGRDDVEWDGALLNDATAARHGHGDDGRARADQCPGGGRLAAIHRRRWLHRADETLGEQAQVGHRRLAVRDVQHRLRAQTLAIDDLRLGVERNRAQEGGHQQQEPDFHKYLQVRGGPVCLQRTPVRVLTDPSQGKGCELLFGRAILPAWHISSFQRFCENSSTIAKFCVGTRLIPFAGRATRAYSPRRANDCFATSLRRKTSGPRMERKSSSTSLVWRRYASPNQMVGQAREFALPGHAVIRGTEPSRDTCKRDSRNIHPDPSAAIPRSHFTTLFRTPMPARHYCHEPQLKPVAPGSTNRESHLAVAGSTPGYFVPSLRDETAGVAPNFIPPKTARNRKWDLKPFSLRGLAAWRELNFGVPD